MRLFLSFWALLATFSSLFSQNIYVRYDDNCMEKYEYRFVESTSSVAYNAYRVSKSDGSKLFFETGLESPVIRKSVSGLTSCANLNLSAADVKAINQGTKRLYIAKKLDSGWAILPVSSVSSMSVKDNMLTYISSNYELQSNIGDNSGQNVAVRYPDSDVAASVFYVSNLPACNQEAYVYKVSPSHICRIDAEVTILPSVGMVREKGADGETFELISINNTPVCDYLAGAKTPSVVVDAEPKPERTERTETEQPIVYSTVPDMEVKETPAVECNVIAGEGEHIVQQGDNLYSIARRYGITVANLRTWNGFNSNSEVIYPCSPVRIKAVQVAENEAVAIEPEPRTESDIPTAANVVVRTKAIKKEPKPVVKMDCNIEAAEGEHIVQQGENLYSIARLYNLNLNKLMAWNGKKENDLIYPCTKLVVATPSVSVEETPAVVLETPKSYATVVKPKKVTPKKVPVSYAAVARPKSVSAKKPVEPAKTTALFVKKGSDLCVVKKGETVSGLAKRNEMSEGQFRTLNNLGEKEGIAIGQVLKCKDCSCNEPIEEAAPKSYNVVVKSKKSKTDDDLTEVVLPKPIKVKEGQAVAVKSVDRTRKFHVVKNEETLYTLSKKYNISLEKLRELNNLEPTELIVVNQLLVLE